MSQVVKVTKRYIIDVLNFMLFRGIVGWDGIDQYNSLPIFHSEEDGPVRIENRGALLIHNKYPWALRLLVTFEDGTNQKVSYRIVAPKNKISVHNPQRVLLPPSNLNLDFSIADVNLGLEDATSYSFFDNFNSTGEISKEVIFSFLTFLLNAEFFAKQEKEIFEDLLLDTCSFPPSSGDIHYSPIYGAGI